MCTNLHRILQLAPGVHYQQHRFSVLQATPLFLQVRVPVPAL
jgi:hypothetical protein